MARSDTLKRIVLLSLLYFLLGKLAFAFSISFRTVTGAIFFPEGVALAFVLLYGVKVVPGIFIGQMALAATTDLSLASSILISIGNSIEAVIGFFILKRLGFNSKNFFLRDYLLLVSTIALVLQPFSAGVGCVSMVAFDQLEPGDFFIAFRYWWIGNTMGQLLLTPLILIFKETVEKNSFQKLIKISLITAVMCFPLLILSGNYLDLHPLHTFSLALAVIIGITIKFEFEGAILSGFILGALAQIMTVEGMGPFTMPDVQERLLYLNSFIVGIAFTSALVGVVLKELKLLNLRYGLILNSVGEGIYGLNLEGEVTFINPEGEKLLGYSKGELQGRHAHTLLHDKHSDGTPYPKEECPIYWALLDGKIHHLENEVFWKKDGTSFPVEYFSRPLIEDGSVAGAVVSFYDISKRKSIEGELQNHRNNLEELVKERTTRLEDEKKISETIRMISEIANYEKDFDKGIKASMEVFAQYLGWQLGHAYYFDEKENRLLSTKLWYMEKPEGFEEFKSVTEKTDFEPGAGLPGRVCRSRKLEWIADVNHDRNFPRANEKQVGVVSGMAFPIISQNKLVGVLEFFSKNREEPEEKLELITKSIGDLLGRIFERQQIDRMKTEFLTTAAHEIRTPLSTILGFSELLLLRDNQGVEKIKKYSRWIFDEAKSLAMIIDDFLDVAKIESQKGINPNLGVHCLKEKILQEIKMMEVNSNGHRFSLDVNGSPEPFSFDEKRINQVLKNIYSNALKYSPAESMVKTQVEFKEQFVHVAISDEGEGMSPQDLDRVFEKFYRANNSSGISGTGLGLNISKYLVEIHGGKIWLESRLGQGTTCHFELPKTLYENFIS